MFTYCSEMAPVYHEADVRHGSNAKGGVALYHFRFAAENGD
jgi:hypothetical protein